MRDWVGNTTAELRRRADMLRWQIESADDEGERADLTECLAHLDYVIAERAV